MSLPIRVVTLDGARIEFNDETEFAVEIRSLPAGRWQQKALRQGNLSSAVIVFNGYNTDGIRYEKRLIRRDPGTARGKVLL